MSSTAGGGAGGAGITGLGLIALAGAGFFAPGLAPGLAAGFVAAAGLFVAVAVDCACANGAPIRHANAQVAIRRPGGRSKHGRDCNHGAVESASVTTSAFPG